MKDEKFKYGGSLKNLIFRWSHEKQYIGGGLPKKGKGGVGGWTVCRFKRGLVVEKTVHQTVTFDWQKVLVRVKVYDLQFT